MPDRYELVLRGDLPSGALSPFALIEASQTDGVLRLVVEVDEPVQLYDVLAQVGRQAAEIVSLGPVSS
jgi:hypothetical protein